MSAGQGAPVPAGDQLASDRERDLVTGVLKEAFAEGRLTRDELAERVAGVAAARSLGQLSALIADLPGAPRFGYAAPAPGPARPGPPPAGRDATVMAILALILGAVALAFPSALLAASPALILGVAAIVRSRRSQRAVRRMALAGLILAVAGLASSALR